MKIFEPSKTYSRMLLQQKNSMKSVLQDNRISSIKQNKITQGIYKFQGQTMQFSKTGKAKKKITIKRNKERDIKYDSLFPVDFSNFTQKTKSDIYRGGAELEYRSRKSALLKITTNQSLSNDEKKFIRKGVKGISFDSFIDKTNLVKKMQGTNWALTIETSIENSINDDNQMPITLELIIGGSHGSTINNLINGAKDASIAIKSLNKEGIFTIENFGRIVYDNVRKKEERQKKADKIINNKELPYSSEIVLQNSNNISANIEWNPDKNAIENEKWGLQITMGVPLDEIYKVGQVLKTNSLNDTSEAKYSENCFLTGRDIIEEWIGIQKVESIIAKNWEKKYKKILII